MMNDVLECNGYTLDLSENVAFPLTFSIADIKDPSKRKRTTALSVTLEGTNNNKSFFSEMYGYHSTGENITFNPLQRMPARYYKKGNLIVPDGVLQLHSVTIENGIPKFKVQVYSESVDVFLTLSTINVSDLDWSDLTHVLSRNSIKASWSTPDGYGYRYPLIQYRSLVNPSTWRTTDLVPYVHLVDVVKRIMNFVGLEYRSNFLNSALMKKVLWGFGGGDYILNTLSPIEINNRKVDVSNIGVSQNMPLPFLNFLPEMISTPFVTLGNWNITSQTENSDISNQYDNGGITVAQQGNYSFRVAGKIRQQISGAQSYLNPAFPMRIVMLKNGVEVSEATATLSSYTSTSFDITFDFSHDMQMNSGDSFNVRIDPLWIRTSNVSNITSHTVTSINPLEINMNSLDTAVTDNEDVLISRFLPETKCSDFLMGVFRQFNLVMSEPDDFGVVDIEPLKDFYSSTDSFDEITPIVDYSKPFEITPTANTVSKNTIFEFKKLEEYDAKQYTEKWGVEYGNYTLVNTSHYAPKSDTKISLPWGTIIPYRVTTSIICPRFVVVDDNGNIKPSKGVARIMFWNGLKSGNWTLRNTINTDFENLTTYPCVHHFDNWQAPTFDLNFSLVKELYLSSSITLNNSYSVYYSQMYNELLSPHGKLVNCYLKLSDLDIKNRNFKRLKMLNGMLFKLNEIGDFDTNKAVSTRVELLRVIEANNAGSGNKPPIDTGVKQPSTGIQIVQSTPISATGKIPTVIKSVGTITKPQILGLIK